MEEEQFFTRECYSDLYDSLLADRDQLVTYAGGLLHEGSLGLLIGAGFAMSMGLPSHETLVKRCVEWGQSSTAPESVRSSLAEVSLPAEYRADDFNRAIDELRLAIHDIELYKKVVQGALYSDMPTLRFSDVHKDLFIAVTALLIGSRRGRIRDVITFNYDSLLEWYLELHGLSVNVVSNNSFIEYDADVKSVHIHGYLPHEDHSQNASERIVFSQREIVSMQMTNSFWKWHLDRFLRSKVFLSVGAGPWLIKQYIPSFLYEIGKWAVQNGVVRDRPFGLAVYPEGEATEKEERELVRQGIFPVHVAHADQPEYLFQIVRSAVDLANRV